MSVNKNKTFIIAELSANHNNSFDIAVKTIEAMADAGADAVKVQTYKPESLTLNVDNEIFGPKKEGIWKGQRPFDILSQGSMPYEWQPKLKKIAESLGLIFFSSPFDFEAVDFLESFNNPIYKIASLEINDIPLIKYIASKGKPMIMSTGVASENDIQLALETCYGVGNNQISLLKCTSEYPATVSQANLLTIPKIKKRFGVNVGVSDHTMGCIVPIVAVSVGATIVEKHFILSRKLGGPDSTFSMEPDEFREMVQYIRLSEIALGKATLDVSEKDKYRRRSLFAVENIKAGEMLTEKNIKSLRPGNGIAPKYYYEILGKIVQKDIIKGEPLNWDFFV
ncbi:MAG: pseudaminic acid synthase [Bacteroidetes bacterium RIFOXYA12_FULL_35_11]|nr:MAG: pseudaminic acid synthase [Bacteroidetes bacterium GWF2_35_48]OFY73065.1 MAG: pseudaminic acid synthase [Bacteroidetes bacterium RIFOXYA12_FULL_35_11]OFY94633.1 MAG: pseudaminic acid synthase [Bacteroidetes bacterium RIFOXYC12_FULL_35_7]HBX53537.1 pseudaminic acid synthase [Bacteroidales bacterium]